MLDRVAIVAAAQTKYEATKLNKHLSQLVLEVSDAVADEVGVSLVKDVDAVVSNSHDHWDGRTISSCPIPEVTGAHLKDETKVADDGAYAVMYGAMKIMSGHHKLILVVSHCCESMTDESMIENYSVDHIFHREIGLDYTICGAMQARRYMEKYKIGREQLARVVAKNKGNGLNNPYTYDGAKLTMSQVMKSDMLAEPLSKLDKKPAADGACAVLLASEDMAKKLCKNPVWITGMSNCYDSHYPGDRDLANYDSLVKATKEAYKMAKIHDPRKQIDFVELSEYFSYQELMWTEGLGLCGRGEGGQLVESGATGMKGAIPVNASGGLLSGVPVTVAGSSRVAEATWQLQGKAGKRQLSGVKRAVAHGCGGLCGQMHCVLVLEKGGK
ncbi:MAG: thiolase family protein [Dehalococcoidia bacterium]|nr:thiolase family protein [Dehalococcoidia bacterium]